MATLPVLFKGPLARAILRDVDPKTQTRRLITRLRGFGRVREFGPSDTAGYDWSFRDSKGRMHDISDKRLREVLPYQVGDRLWVRETIARRPPPNDDFSMFAADSTPTMADCWPWKKNVLTSIHCPRGLSRIDLEITDVRVQQLWDISDEDAKAECIQKLEHIADDQRVPGPGFNRCRLGDQTHRFAFALKWEEIYGEEMWDSNPWVLAVTFRRVRP